MYSIYIKIIILKPRFVKYRIKSKNYFVEISICSHTEKQKTRFKPCPCVLVFSRPIEKGKRLSQKLETQTFHMNILSYQSVAWIGCHSFE